MRAFLGQRQRFRPAATPISFGVFLVLALCWGSVVAEAHPGMRAAMEAPVEFDTSSTGPAPLDETRPAPPLSGPSRENPSAPPTSTAWIWVVLLTLPALAAARRRCGPRALILTLALLLGVLACESAIHSVHHLKDSRHAEACPVFSASQHVNGLTASTATPDLPPPSAASYRLSTHPVQILSRALDGEQSRAPPARLA